MKIAPRVPTPAPSDPGRSTVRLPDDVVADHVARLKLLAIISGGLWAIGMLMDSVLSPAVLGLSPNRPALVIEGFAVMFSAAMYLHVQ